MYISNMISPKTTYLSRTFLYQGIYCTAESWEQLKISWIWRRLVVARKEKNSNV